MTVERIAIVGPLVTVLAWFAACGIGAQGVDPETRGKHAKLLVWTDESGQEHEVTSPSEWATRRRSVLRGMEEAMGSLPNRSSLPPLDVRELARSEGESFTRLEISFVAEETDRVPAYLYLPKDRKPKEKFPAVVALHPTHPLGKGVVAGLGDRPNRGYAVELADRGFIVIAPDYPSFGDYPYDFEADTYVSGTMKGVFNHMRCVDLLVARGDVDPDRIGAIGHSLGGHNAMFLGAFDERVKVLVSSCGWTPFHDYYGGKIAGWTSPRYMPRLRDVYKLDPDRVPFDFYEVVAALAPRAFFSSSPVSDENFAVGGVRKAVAQSLPVYRLLGAQSRLQVRYPTCGHDFPLDVRVAAYEFIDEALHPRSSSCEAGTVAPPDKGAP